MMQRATVTESKTTQCGEMWEAVHNLLQCTSIGSTMFVPKIGKGTHHFGVCLAMCTVSNEIVISQVRCCLAK
eukprot:4689034-Amphidinium_carterae.1